MHDQADELRQLARRRNLHPPTGGAAPRLLAVTGGKGGVGVTTIAVNLAVALARSGRRTVLVDADLTAPDVATLCGLDEGYSLADVLSARRTIHEVLQPGPMGLQVVPGPWARSNIIECSPTAQERLIGELRGLGAHTDIVVVDIGAGPGRVPRRFWQTADEVLLVTTPDQVAIMDAYAAIKLQADPTRTLVRALINQTSEDNAPDEVFLRLARSCQRFLGLRLASAGSLPADRAIAAAGEARQPFVTAWRNLPATLRLERLAEALAEAGPGAGVGGPPAPHIGVGGRRAAALREQRFG